MMSSILPYRIPGSWKTITLLAFLILATLVRCNPNPVVEPRAEKGELDTAEFNLHKSAVSLVGQWSFHWGNHVDPANPPDEPREFRYVLVPSHWTNYSANPSAASRHDREASETAHPGREQGYPVRGLASFWLQIQVDPDVKELALRIPAMDTAFVLYWNGKEIARNGYITDNLEGTMPTYYATQSVRVPNQGKNLLVLHMANDVYPRPGLRDAILLGTPHLIFAISENRNYISFFILGALGLLAIYHFGIYAMRKEDRSPLYFALFCILIVVRLLVTGEGLAFRFWPITWKGSTLLEYLTFYMAPSVFILFLRSLYPEERIKYADEVLHGICVLFALVAILTPIGFYTQTLLAFHIIAAFMVAYGLGVILFAVARKRETAMSFLLGILVLISAMVNDILYSQRLIQSAFVFPIGVYIFFFSQAFLLSRRFAIAFRTAETLTRELDQKVQDRTVDLEAARNRSDTLLRNILPDSVAAELKDRGEVKPQYHPLVTVLFVDFVDFTRISEKWHPNELVGELHACFSAFDEIAERNSLEKLKTIGDSYMAAAGIPESRPDHAVLACEAALEIASWMKAYQSRMELARKPVWTFRIGLHSGPVTAGVIGTNKFAYDIWGDTVNTASRMERFAPAGEINLSEATYELVKGRYDCAERQSAEVPGKGKMKMYGLSRK